MVINWILNQLTQQSRNDLERAREIIRAADMGELQVEPEKVFELARALGLEAPPHSDLTQTVEEMRRLLAQRGEL